MKEKAIACLIYDFDKTLSPRDMQEYGFLPGLNITPDVFWEECRIFAIEHQVDPVLAYMYKMQEKAHGSMRLTRSALAALGAQVEFFPGVESWFDRVNAYGAAIGLAVEHYIISSGLKEIIEGSRVARHFKEIFAASFVFGADETPLWPATAVNYTSKTQHLFRINKGILDITNHNDLNDYTPENWRRIPFPNMIYLGDGLTDVPSMKMVRSKGGISIMVHPPGELALGDDMLLQRRVDFSVTADYSKDGGLEAIVFALLRKIMASDECVRLHNTHIDAALSRRPAGPFYAD